MGTPIMCGGGGSPSGHRCTPWPQCDGIFWTRDQKFVSTVGPLPGKGPGKVCDPWPECLKDSPGGILKKIGLGQGRGQQQRNPCEPYPQCWDPIFWTRDQKGKGKGKK